MLAGLGSLLRLQGRVPPASSTSRGSRRPWARGHIPPASASIFPRPLPVSRSVFCSLIRTSDWIRAHLTPVWPHLDFLASAKTLCLVKMGVGALACWWGSECAWNPLLWHREGEAELGLHGRGPGLGLEACVQTSLRHWVIPSAPSLSFPLHTVAGGGGVEWAAVKSRPDRCTRSLVICRALGLCGLLFCVFTKL